MSKLVDVRLGLSSKVKSMRLVFIEYSYLPRMLAELIQECQTLPWDISNLRNIARRYMFLPTISGQHLLALTMMRNTQGLKTYSL